MNIMTLEHLVWPSTISEGEGIRDTPAYEDNKPDGGGSGTLKASQSTLSTQPPFGRPLTRYLLNKMRPSLTYVVGEFV